MFKEILKSAKRGVIKKLVVDSKRSISALWAEYKKYKERMEKLIAEDNFDMSEYDDYLEECRLIEKSLECAIILK